MAGLLIVIFSQITGFGISNYGIKKGLPKLVVGALLVNLSYVICQGSVDIANILGGRIGDFFEGLLAQTAPAGLDIGVANTWLTTIIIGVATAVIIERKALLTKVLIGFLLLLCICLLAMLLLYIILAIRQSMCILLVVFSPIAFACNMIPGTKKVFDFWFKTFKTLLLTYPICSLIVYGGGFAGAIVYSSWTTSGNSGNLFKALGFLLIATVPYFYIPSAVLKGMTIMSDITQRIGDFTMKTGKTAFGNSLLMQSLGLRDKRMREIARAGKKIDRKTGKLVNRRGFSKFTPHADPTTGKFLGARKALNHARNWAGGTKAWGAFVDYNRANARAHLNSANSSFSAVRRTNKYRSGRKDWLDYDENGDLVSMYDANGNRKLQSKTVGGVDYRGYYDKAGNFIVVQRKDTATGKWVRESGTIAAGSSTFTKQNKAIGALRRGWHEGVSQRFKNASRVHKKYQDISKAYGDELATNAITVEKTAFANRLKDNLTLNTAGKKTMLEDLLKKAYGVDKNGKKITTGSNSDIASAQASVMLSSLLDDGEEGRAALEAIIDRGFVGPTIDPEIKEFVKNVITSAEMEKIKKKNPILFNKIKELQGGGSNMTTSISVDVGRLNGMSSKQFAEMDYNAQSRIVDQLSKIVDLNLEGANDQLVITAMTLAEGALYDPDIRAALSPEHIAALEHIVDMRKNQNMLIHTNTRKSIKIFLTLLRSMKNTEY